MANPTERQVTTDDVLGIMREHGKPREPWTAPEIGDVIGCSRKSASNRLMELVDDDTLHTKKVGARGRVFWIAE